MSKAGIINRIFSTALSIVLIFGAGAISVAEESEVNISNTHIALSVSQDLINSDGDRVNIYSEVFNDAGESINASDKLTIYYKKGSEGKENKYNNKYLNLSKNNTYYFYAVYEGDETYAAQVSDTSVYSVKKFADLKGSLVSSATVTGQATGSITVGDVYPDLGYVSALTYYKADNPGTRITVDGSTITGLSAGTYYVSVPAKIDGDQIFISSGNRPVEITEGAQPVIYQIRTTEDENISWTKTYFESKEGSTGSFTTYVSPKNSEEYYIKDVVAEPSGNANVLYYASTGEVSISDITGNVSLKAVYEKKEKPAQVDIEYIRPNENSNYSENNPSIQFTIGVSVKDDAGNPIPDATVYFKADKNETDSSRKTDPNGVAQFKYSYGIVSGNDSADYEGSVSLNEEFKNAKSFPIHLIKQKKSDLVLYEDQIFGTYPNENNGKVVDVPDGYEIWTGETHQGAYVPGTGSWEKAINGEFVGLSAGQHLLRAGEKYDSETGTFYFSSNQADFFVPRALWTLTIDKDKSENVVFDGDLVQFIEPGRNVYIPVKAIDGYEISEIIFSKNSYISGDPIYYSENGYYKIDAISGTVTAYVVAVKSDNNSGDNADDSDDDKTVNEKNKDQIDPDQKDNKKIDQDNQDKENNDKENPELENSVEYNSDKENTNTDTVDKNTDNTDSVTSTDINTETNIDTNADINTDTNTDTNTGTNIDTNADINTEANIDTKADTNTETNTDTNNDTEVNNNIEAEDNTVNSEINRVTNPQEWLASDNNAVADNVVPEEVQNDGTSAENDTEVKVSDNTVTTETIENTESALAGEISGSDIAELSVEEPVKSGISAAKIALISTALSLLAAAIIAASIIYLKRKKEKEL